MVSGRADAAALQDRLAERLAADGQIKIIHYSDEYPSSSIVANASVPQHDIELVARALLEFEPLGEHGRDLHNWNRTEMPNGFRQSTHDDYRELRTWLDDLNLLQPLQERAE